MAARRLLVVMLVLLGISTLAAALVPPQRLREGSTSSTAETTVPDTLPSGKLFTATIEVGGGKHPVVPVRLGDELVLLVKPAADKPALNDDVEIPGLGLVEPMDRFAPARFDILAPDPGTYAIRLVEGGRKVGRIEVRAPKRAEPKQPKAKPATPAAREA